MAIINRITRLFRADMHAVLDRLEEPDSQLRQAIREMEEAVGNQRQGIKLIQHEQSELQTRTEELENKLQAMEEELQMCLDSQQESLARGLVRRKLENLRLQKLLQKRMQTLRKYIEEQEQQFRENHRSLQSMQQKLELLNETQKAGAESATAMYDIAVSEDEVEIAYLRELQKRQPS